MLWMSEEAIEYAVAKCRNEKGYKIIIALANRGMMRSVDYKVRSLIKDTDKVKFRRGGGDFLVEFENGSFIRAVYASDNARGHRAHLVVADDAINDDILNCVFKPMEILKHIERQRRRDYDMLRTEPSISMPYYTFRPYNLDLSGTDLYQDKEFEDVSEDEFMKILNIPSPQ